MLILLILSVVFGVVDEADLNQLSLLGGCCLCQKTNKGVLPYGLNPNKV